ncbi:YggS family pyridoxal phosphate-dependent enzyme [Puniceicoccaceae bacterium K14]|nr:YggS family pyridoxal phosphate-dependent enzyme [Puniceicoccaceae bacterium K14]
MNINFNVFEARVKEVRSSINGYCEEAGRQSESVALLPVTKNHPVDAAEYAFKAGFGMVGENRVQEAEGKKPFADPSLKWELIGPLQSNKVKKAVQVFTRIQTVDRVKLAGALQRHAEDSGIELAILLQVNAGRDPNKSGVSLEDASALMESAISLPNLRVEGLMTIAPLSDEEAVARRAFAALRECRDKLEIEFGVKLPELSMGMSGDMREAILEGSTMVRVGTALYGKRDYL